MKEKIYKIIEILFAVFSFLALCCILIIVFVINPKMLLLLLIPVVTFLICMYAEYKDKMDTSAAIAVINLAFGIIFMAYMKIAAKVILKYIGIM